MRCDARSGSIKDLLFLDVSRGILPGWKHALKSVTAGEIRIEHMLSDDQSTFKYISESERQATIYERLCRPRWCPEIGPCHGDLHLKHDKLFRMCILR